MRRSFFFIFCIFAMLPSFAAIDEDWQITTSKRILGTHNIRYKERQSAYSIITPREGKGFIILTNTNQPRVIGYSNESNWSPEEMPPILLDWLNRYNANETLSKKQNYESDVEQRISIPPLLNSHWHQKSPYNDYAPIIEDGNVKCAAGCVAIAAAQVTYYWWKDNPPATLKDTPIYPYGGAPVTYSIPKGTPNDWELIKSEYVADDSPQSRDAAARLCYVLGTTSYLNYASSTGGHINEAANAMYSQYQLLSQYVARREISQEQWDSLLYSEVLNGRPVMCSGHGSGGHAFVLDGYDHETDLYHFNFGWGGSGDGYFPIDDSDNALGGYKSNQAVVYGIHPRNRNIAANLHLSGVSENLLKLRVEINNSSTLPATMRLFLADKNGSTQNEEGPRWVSTIENDGNLKTYEIELNVDYLSENIYLKLLDEYDALISELHVDTSDIDEQLNPNTHFINEIYGIDGVQRKDTLTKGIYIIKREGKTVVILK